jgi:hypothetical protein
MKLRITEIKDRENRKEMMSEVRITSDRDRSAIASQQSQGNRVGH